MASSFFSYLNFALERAVHQVRPRARGPAIIYCRLRTPELRRRAGRGSIEQRALHAAHTGHKRGARHRVQVGL